MDRTQEIVAFKRAINLTEYAASEGYAVDRKESTAANVVMRDASNDKIMVSKSATTGYWLYYSLRDDERGTIIDFIQTRKDLNLGHIRKELRPWMGAGAQGKKSVTPGLFVNEIKPCSRDLDAVVKAFSRMKAETPHAYLIDRGISAAVLFSCRFQGRPESELRRHRIEAQHPLNRRDALNEGRSLNSGDTSPAPLVEVYIPCVAQRRPESELRRHTRQSAVESSRVASAQRRPESELRRHAIQYGLPGLTIVRSTKAGV